MTVICEYKVTHLRLFKGKDAFQCPKVNRGAFLTFISHWSTFFRVRLRSSEFQILSPSSVSQIEIWVALHCREAGES